MLSPAFFMQLLIISLQLMAANWAMEFTSIRYSPVKNL